MNSHLTSPKSAANLDDNLGRISGCTSRGLPDDGDDSCQLLLRLGFEERTHGSHHSFRKEGIEEEINLQRDDSKAKVYQVRQVGAVILKCRLGGELILFLSLKGVVSCMPERVNNVAVRFGELDSNTQIRALSAMGGVLHCGDHSRLLLAKSKPPPSR